MRELDLDRGPPQKCQFASTTAHAINLSPTLADASVGVAWHVASVRCQVAVRSGEWQVSGVRWRCACVSECACECACASANVHVHVHVYVYVHVKNNGFDY